MRQKTFYGVFGARVNKNLGVRILRLISKSGERRSEYVRKALLSYTDLREINIKENVGDLKKWEKETSE